MREQRRKEATFIAISLLVLCSFSVVTVPALAQGYDNWAQSWKEVGGTTDTALAATNFNGIYIFGKGIADKAVYVNSIDNAGKWKGWSLVPGGGTTDAALAAASFNNKLYVFAKGITDKAIYVNTMDNTGKWSGWSLVPGGGTTDAAPAVASFNNKLYLFTKGIANKAIYVNTMDNTGKWSGFSLMPGGGTTDAALAAASFNNKLYVFAKGIADKGIYINSMDNTGKWSGWSLVPGGGTTDVALGAASWVGNYGPHLYLFSKGIGDKGIYVNSMDNTGKWNGFSLVPGGETTDSAIAATGIDNMCLYVFSKGLDQHIYETTLCHVVG